MLPLWSFKDSHFLEAWPRDFIETVERPRVNFLSASMLPQPAEKYTTVAGAAFFFHGLTDCVPTSFRRKVMEGCP